MGKGKVDSGFWGCWVAGSSPLRKQEHSIGRQRLASNLSPKNTSWELVLTNGQVAYEDKKKQGLLGGYFWFCDSGTPRDLRR